MMADRTYNSREYLSRQTFEIKICKTSLQCSNLHNFVWQNTSICSINDNPPVVVNEILEDKYI